MAIILNIDTAVETASVCLAKENSSLQIAINGNKMDHASWLHVAVRNIMRDANVKLEDLNAVAVSIGPGSYTGLRVGLSAAKGFCFALGIPLIAVSTLEMMANAAIGEVGDLICPMIDARRMEVFTAVYDKQLTTISEPSALILDPNSFLTLLESSRIVFLGNGSEKFKNLTHHSNASFSDIIPGAANMFTLSYRDYLKRQWADLIYTDPFYLKEFHDSRK